LRTAGHRRSPPPGHRRRAPRHADRDRIETAHHPG